MTTVAELEALGLTVRHNGDALEAQLELSTSQLINPLTRSFIHRVEFTVVKDRLIIIGPPELIGAPPFAIAELADAAELEARLGAALNDHIYHLQRRSTELQTLGLSPKVEPETLQLSAIVQSGDLALCIVSDKRGNFRLGSARKGSAELEVSSASAFELSEFRELDALTEYLAALIGQMNGEVIVPAREAEATPAAGMLSLREVSGAFGGGGLIPPRTALEILVELRVGEDTYRFAAARVHGQAFRGLLAGTKTGKLWAERFELSDFPGVAQLVAKVLAVPVDQVHITSGGAR